MPFDGRNGGAERTVWETLLEMERIHRRAGAKDPAAITQVLDLAKAFERVSLPNCAGLGDARQISQADFAGAVRLFGAPAAGTG